jgi:threonylcarbamoyladenosine tRNA methylthiotransferase MtaB
MPSFFIKTLGCKVNSYDSHALENRFRAIGWSAAESPDRCDVWVLNTCTVTQAADRDVRNFIRQIRKKNPAVLPVVTGCFVQANPDEAAALGDVDLIVGNDRKAALVEIIADRLNAFRSNDTPSTAAFVHPQPPSDILFDQAGSDQTRAVLKIQDGCDGVCSYCIVPRARGRSRSVPSGVVLNESKRLLGEHCKEIVLTGIHVGMYGNDHRYAASGSSEPASFDEFLHRLTALPEWAIHRARLRLSSIEPNELTDDLIATLLNSPARICDHFHLPLQSGSDAVLKRMNRTYTRALYADRVAAIRGAFPRANIGADVIAGFPGETDADFAQTCELVESSGLNSLHVFPYSRRPGTPAADMPDQVPERVITRRADRLREWSRHAHLDFARSFVGAPLEVLWERTVDKNNRRHGHAANYLGVRAIDGGDVRWNEFSTVTIASIDPNGNLIGAVSA